LLGERFGTSGELGDVAAVYASLLPRTRQTAELAMAQLGSWTIEARCGFCELHAGEADGLTRRERLDRFGGPESLLDSPDDVIAPGGESWNGFVDRAAEALRNVIAEHHDETTVVFTHSGVIGASAVAFGGLDAGSLFTTPPACTSITEWRWRNDDRPRLLTYGDAGHLPVVLRYAGLPD
jgi:broad specificity phosphatase PhoE